MTKPLALNYGATVFYQGKPYVVTQESNDFTTVVLRDVDSGKLSQVAIVDLASCPEESPVPQHDLAAVPEKDWQEAMRIYGIIQPLLDLPSRVIGDVVARAEECKVLLRLDLSVDSPVRKGRPDFSISTATPSRCRDKLVVRAGRANHQGRTRFEIPDQPEIVAGEDLPGNRHALQTCPTQAAAFQYDTESNQTP